MALTSAVRSRTPGSYSANIMIADGSLAMPTSMPPQKTLYLALCSRWSSSISTSASPYSAGLRPVALARSTTSSNFTLWRSYSWRL